MPDILLLEWNFEPADLFEQSTTARIGQYEFAIEWGRVQFQCQILVDVESDDYWLRQRTEAHQRMVAILLAAQTFSDQPCKLLKPAVSRIRESGGVDLYAFPPDRHRKGCWKTSRHSPAGIPIERILRAYPSLDREKVELAGIFAEANPPRGRPRVRSELPKGAVIISDRTVPRRKKPT